MHELSIAQAILEHAARAAEGRSVQRVDVRIGHFRQVVPDALQFSWEMLTEHTDLAGAELVIEHVPAVVHCRACEVDSVLDLPVMACPNCEALDVKLVSGEEFQIAWIDVGTPPTPEAIV